MSQGQADARHPDRDQLARLLRKSEARASLEDAVRDLPAHLRGVRPSGLPHSAWELLEHIRIVQRDLLDFTVGESYQELEWPADYWPAGQEPPGPDAWDRALESIRQDRDALARLAADPDTDLAEVAKHGTDQTRMRELLLVIDHTAYHVGQLVLVRQLLGAWPPR